MQYTKEDKTLIATESESKSNRYTREEVETTITNLKARMTKLNAILAEMDKLGL